jgi:hypothetical protein
VRERALGKLADAQRLAALRQPLDDEKLGGADADIAFCGAGTDAQRMNNASDGIEDVSGVIVPFGVTRDSAAGARFGWFPKFHGRYSTQKLEGLATFR